MQEDEAQDGRLSTICLVTISMLMSMFWILRQFDASPQETNGPAPPVQRACLLAENRDESPSFVSQGSTAIIVSSGGNGSGNQKWYQKTKLETGMVQIPIWMVPATGVRFLEAGQYLASVRISRNIGF